MPATIAGRATAAATIAVALAACGGLEDPLVKPGITAIDQSRELTCSTDATTLQTAIDAYQLLSDAPPADESVLITAGYLREASEAWDIADGVLVPQASACGVVTATTPSGSVAQTAPASELGQLVTGSEAPPTPEELLDELTDEQIAGVGGVACARELMTIFDAGERFVAELGTDPTSLQQLADTGYLPQPATLWVEQDGSLQPAAGSSCIAPA